jgi:hypothetical protein
MIGLDGELDIILEIKIFYQNNYRINIQSNRNKLHLYNAKALLFHTLEMQATYARPTIFGLVLRFNLGAVVSRTENLSCIVGGIS